MLGLLKASQRRPQKAEIAGVGGVVAVRDVEGAGLLEVVKSTNLFPCASADRALLGWSVHSIISCSSILYGTVSLCTWLSPSGP